MGSEVKGHMASILAERDPQALKAGVRAVNREKARRALVDQNAGEAAQRSGRFFGGLLGTNMIQPVHEAP
jgi:hypothetical protein